MAAYRLTESLGKARKRALGAAYHRRTHGCSSSRARSFARLLSDASKSGSSLVKLDELRIADNMAIARSDQIGIR